MPTVHDHLSNEELMIAYVCGDNTAFETLYTRNESILLRFIHRTLGTALSAQSEEVFQDVWMRIISARSSYRPPQANGVLWKTWAFAIAHYACIDRLRAQNKYVDVHTNSTDQDNDPLEWIQAELGQTQRSSEDESYWRAAGGQLLKCLDKLPQEQRSVFIIHHEEDNSIEEIAAVLNVPFETVKSRLRYAMKKLRHCMQNYLGELGKPS